MGTDVKKATLDSNEDWSDCVTDVKLVKVKKECKGEESSSSSSEEEEEKEEKEEKEEDDDDKYEPDLDLEADFPQGKYRLYMEF